MSEKSRKRIYRVEPPDELIQKGKFIRWQPERITVKEGIQQTAVSVLYGYVVIAAVLLFQCLKVLSYAPLITTLPAFFGYSSVTVMTPLLVAGIYGMQIYLIYRDLIRRSMARTLLLVPGTFFIGSMITLFTF